MTKKTMVRSEEAAAEYVTIEVLRPWVRNPRRNDHAVKNVADSIRRFGFGSPLLARRETGEIIAGHTRLKAAILLKMDTVPVRYMDLDEAEAHALALADNKLGELAEWDPDGLLAELRAGTDLLALGWSEFELEQLAAEPAGETKAWVDGSKPANAQRIAMVTVHLSTEESPAIEAALAKALVRCPSRGEALALICREWSDAAG